MVTLTTADNALKNVYLGVVSEQLNTNINPLLAKIKQTTSDVWGKDIVKLAPYGLNGGVGAGSEDGDLPLAGGNTYAQFRLALKNLYGKIEISDKAIRASSSSAGAFVNLLNAEMEGLLRASSYNFGRMLYGDGSGKLATIASNTANQVVVDSVLNLMEGMMVDVVDDSGNVTEGYNAVRISSINRATKTITFQGKTSMTANALQNKILVVQGSFNKEITGLGAIFKSTGSLYGLNRADYGWMIPYMRALDGEKDITDIIMQTAIDELEQNADSKVDFIVCSAGVKRAYQEYLSQYRHNVEVMDLAGGYKAISYNGIPLVSDRFVENGTMYLLNTKEFNLHQLCDWKWLEGEDGRVIRQNQNRPTYSATLVKYADIICDKPSGQAKISNILES